MCSGMYTDVWTQKSRPVARVSVTRDCGAPVFQSSKLRHTRHRWRIVEPDAENAEASAFGERCHVGRRWPLLSVQCSVETAWRSGWLPFPRRCWAAPSYRRLSHLLLRHRPGASEKLHSPCWSTATSLCRTGVLVFCQVTSRHSGLNADR